MNFEEALFIVNKYIPQQNITYVQEIVFRASWEGKSYIECANTHGYSSEYLKTVGYQLWQILSNIFNESVTKNNLHSVIRRQYLIAKKQPLEKELLTEKSVKETNICQHNVDISLFYGREAESEILSQWILEERCRLISIFGMSGIGKTSLTCKLLQLLSIVKVPEQTHPFEFVYWRSLEDTPLIEDVILEIICNLSSQEKTEVNLPGSLENKISLLMKYLHSSRCLLVLDNIEKILDSGDRTGCYVAEHQGYREFFRHVAEENHQSSLILIGTEKPREIDLLEGEKLPIRSLHISGLQLNAGRAIFENKGSFKGSNSDWNWLIEYYGGNPLFLKRVAQCIQNLFDSNLGDFIEFCKKDSIVFDDINQILDNHFQRLSNFEQSVMYWLAINRKPVSLSELRDYFHLVKAKQNLLEALMSLERRSFIEKRFSQFTLQPMILEYVSKKFIEKICEEILTGEVNLIMSHALISSQAVDSIREMQVRFILQPTIQQLFALAKSHKVLECKLNKILSELQKNFTNMPGYGLENVACLASYLNVNLAFEKHKKVYRTNRLVLAKNNKHDLPQNVKTI